MLITDGNFSSLPFLTRKEMSQLQAIVAETAVLVNELKRVISTSISSHARSFADTEEHAPATTPEVQQTVSLEEALQPDIIQDIRHSISQVTRDLSPADVTELLSALHVHMKVLPTDDLLSTILASASKLQYDDEKTQSKPPQFAIAQDFYMAAQASSKLPSHRRQPLHQNQQRSTTPFSPFPSTRSRHASPSSFQQTRQFWSERRLQKLEVEANDPTSRADPKKQAELYKELLRSGNYYALIDRFENQPQLDPTSSRYPAASRAADIQRIQHDPDCLKPYITALAREGNMDRLTERFLAATGQTSKGSESAATGEDVSHRQTLGEGREHLVHTNIGEWERALSRRGGAMRNNRMQGINIMRPLGAPGAGPDGKGDPIQVIITEAWSWSKFVRKLGSKVLLGLLLMTGLSVLLDQQGIIKSGKLYLAYLTAQSNDPPSIFK